MRDAPPERSPREGDAALDALRRAVEAQTQGTICLTGPSGPARSQLLQAFTARLDPAIRSIRLEAADLSPAGVWIEIARSLGFTPGYDARRRVLHHLGDLVERKAALLLLAEQADALSADTLASLVGNARGETGLHLVLAAASERSLAGPLPEDCTLVRWDGAPPAEPQPSAPGPAVRPPAPPLELDAEPAAAPLPRAPRTVRRRKRRGTGWRVAGLVLAAGIAFFVARNAPWRRELAPLTAEDEAAASGKTEPAPPAASRVSSEPAATPAPPVAPVEPPAPAAPEARVEPPPPPEEAPAPAPTPAPVPAPVEPAPQAKAAAPPPAPVPAPRPPPAPRAAPEPEAEPPLARGALRVESATPVRIEIDGRPYGSTPIARTRLPRGVHRVIARYPDGATALKTVTLGDEDVSIFYR